MPTKTVTELLYANVAPEVIQNRIDTDPVLSKLTAKIKHVRAAADKRIKAIRREITIRRLVLRKQEELKFISHTREKARRLWRKQHGYT